MRKVLACGMTAACFFLMAVPCAAFVNFAKRKTPEIRIEAPGEEIPLGEELLYHVSWFGIPIGTGEIGIKRCDEGREYCIESVAKDNEFLSAFYPVIDILRSRMDPETLRSLRFEKDLKEGRYRAHERMVFDYEENIGHYESFTNGSKKTMDVPGPIHDILTAFYWIRRQPLEVGKRLRTRVNSDEKNADLFVEVLRSEHLELRGYEGLDVVVLEPKAEVKGVLVARRRSFVYVTADARRVPVLIRLNTPYGPVTGVLDKALWPA